MTMMPDTVNLVFDSKHYVCKPLGKAGEWAFPVGHESQFPPEMWYAAQQHSASHTGIDLNLAKYEFGDVERRLGLAIFSVSDGYVSYLTQNWSDVPMLVIHTLHFGKPLYIRYAHLIPAVMIGETVKSGQRLGAFADWTRGAGGDHLHTDCAFTPFTREWLDTSVEWGDIVDIYKQHLDPLRVDAMLAKD